MQSRDSTTIDGVYGRELMLRADVASGDWAVVVKLEVEHTADQSVRLFLQAQEQELGWQSLRPPAEPKEAEQRLYRIYQNRVRVDSGSLLVRIVGVAQDVRLLGVSLFRLSDAWSTETLDRLDAIRDYRAGTVPIAMMNELESASDGNSAYAAELLRTLSDARRLFSMRGWSWARETTGLGMFERLHQAIFLADGILGSHQTPHRNIREQALYLRGRILYWLHREGAEASVGERGLRDLRELYERHSDDRTLAMYLGEKIDLVDPCDRIQPSMQAPEWSILQHEILCRMRQIAHWWVNERQAENGELGGKWGDDVELLRWWVPLALIGDQVTIRGWRKLADGVWHSEEVADGYAAKVSDVEHASELIADTAPIMAVVSDEAQYLERLSKTVEHFDNIWTGQTSRGHLHFRSAWFSAKQVETAEPKGRDVEYNTRAVQPMRYLAWRRPEQQLVAQLHRWSSAWVNASMRTDKGKPRGLVPPSIRYPDEAINGDELTWYQPRMYWKYYDWRHHAGSLMMDQLLFTYTVTGDAQLLKPMFEALDLIRSQQSNLGQRDPRANKIGSHTWAAQQLLNSETFWTVVSQWRQSSADSQYDDLILSYAGPYARYRISGNQQYLLDAMEETLADIRYNTPLKTSEAIHTDRVYVPNSELLKAMLTGDGIRNNLSPYYAITWEKTEQGFTCLVRDAASHHVDIELFSHASKSCHIILRSWQMKQGYYRVTIREVVDGGHEKEREVFELALENRGQRIELDIPAQKLIRIHIAQK